MQIYLAARYGRFPEMQRHATALMALGHQITSRWIWGVHQALDSHLLHPTFRHRSAQFAAEDQEDLRCADTFIGFSEILGLPSRGGRHVELGMALAWEKRILIIGGAEHVFHCLPGLEHYSTLQEVPAFVGLTYAA
jgi:hypothetical protein